MSRSRRSAALVNLSAGYVTITLSTVANLVLVPVILLHVDLKLYGAWLASGGVLAWLAVLDFGLASLMVQRIAEAYGREDPQRIGDYFSTGLILQLGLVVTLAVAATAMAPYLPAWFGVEGSSAHSLSIAFIVAALANGASILNNGVVGFLKALQITTIPSTASIIGAILGPVITLLLLDMGRGLASLPIGLMIAITAQLVVNGLYSVLVYRREIRAPFRPSPKTVIEFARISGPLFLSKLSGAATARSDAVLIALLMRPELAAAYVLTRRAGDVVQQLLEMLGGAVFAPFSNLVGGEDRNRTRDVYRQIVQGYAGAGAIMVGTFLAGNAAFVEMWVGPDKLLEEPMTLLVGMSVLSAGAAVVLNYLLSATGQLIMSARMSVWESAMRLLAMAVLLKLLGVVGLPAAALLTAPIAAWIAARRTFQVLSIQDSPFGGNRSGYLVCGVVLLAGALVGTLTSPETWGGLLSLLAAYVTAASAAVGLAVPATRDMVVPLRLRNPPVGAPRAADTTNGL